MPQSHYSVLSSTATFICLVCAYKTNEASQQALRGEIAALKAELQELRAALKDCQQSVIAPIAAEISDLRSEVQHNKNAKTLPSAPQRSFSDAVRGKRTGARPQAHHRSVPQEPRPRPQLKGHARPGKVLVQGARKIWGTMINCTTAAVLGAISKLTPSISNLRVKRKYKSLSNNKIAWWFIIHGQESELGTLEAQWERVQLQTGWTLQPCYMPKDEQQARANAICIPEEPVNSTEEPVNLGGSDDQQSSSQLSTSAETEQGLSTQDASPLNPSEEPGDARTNAPHDPRSPATNNSFLEQSHQPPPGQ